MLKKVKAIILTLWFVISILLSIYLCLVDYDDLEVIALLNIAIPFILIISDEKLLEMRLW